MVTAPRPPDPVAQSKQDWHLGHMLDLDPSHRGLLGMRWHVPHTLGAQVPTQACAQGGQGDCQSWASVSRTAFRREGFGPPSVQVEPFPVA